jgi:sodium transport system permease protein
MSLALPFGRILSLMVAAMPLTLMLGGLEMIICIFARSFKEAQNYVTPLQLLLMLPALVVGFVPGLQMPAAAYVLPVVAQTAIFRDIVSGNPVNGSYLALSLASSAVYALAAVAVAVRTFERESVLFRT